MLGEYFDEYPAFHSASFIDKPCDLTLVAKDSKLHAKRCKHFKSSESLNLPALADAMTRWTWSPIIWKSGVRLSSNFEYSDCVVLDFDSPEVSMASTLENKLADYIHIVGTTKSHQVPKDGITCDRFRVLLALDRRITDAREYQHTLTKLIEEYGADPACSDPARFFWPCTKIVNLQDHGHRQEVIEYDGSIEFASDNDKTVVLDEVHSGSQDTELTREAGRLRSFGYGEQDIFEFLKARFKRSYEKFQNPAKPYTDKDFTRIARSVCKKDPGSADVLLVSRNTDGHIEIVENDTAPVIEKAEPIIIQKEEKYEPKRAIEKELLKAYEMADGLVKDIAVDILGNSRRAYPQFALAASLGIVSGVVQGGFCTQEIGNLSLYQWITAPAAGGKDSYLKAVTRYLEASNRFLVCEDPSTPEGFQRSFFTMNCRTAVIDELQDVMASMGKKGSDQNKILTYWKELYNSLYQIGGKTLARTRYPYIYYPRFSVFGAGTETGFKDCLTSQMVSDGLMSRFIVWPFFDVADKEIMMAPHEPNPKIVERLRQFHFASISELRKTKVIDEKGFQEDDALFTDILDGRAAADAKHVPQTYPIKQKIGMSAEAIKTYETFTRSQEAKFRKFLKDGEDTGNNFAPGSIADRAPATAMRIATVHAIGRFQGSPSRINAQVDGSDMEFGIQLCRALSDYLCDLVMGGTVSEDEKMLRANGQKIITQLRLAGEPLKKRDLMRGKFCVNLPTRKLDEALLYLAPRGMIVIYQQIESDYRPIGNPEEIDKVPRGCLFKLPH